MITYRVQYQMDGNYDVIEITIIPDEETNGWSGWSNSDTTEERTAFSGGLADCEAFIRLREGGYM